MSRRTLAFAVALLLASWPAGDVARAGEGRSGDTLRSDTWQIAQNPSGAPGMISSRSYQPLPQGLALTVKPFDDSDTNIMIRDHLVDELKRSAYRMSDTAVLELSFETSVAEVNFSGPEPTLGTLSADAGGDLDVNVNVWSSTKDSVLGGRQRKGAARKHNSFRLNAVLRDLRNGKRLWEADAVFAMVVSDQDRIAQSIVPQVVSALGQTVAARPFELE